MSGHLGDLDRKQEAALLKLRQNTVDVLRPADDDYFLLRWLRARQFNVKKAEHMLRTSLKWRAWVGADTILETEMHPVLKKYFVGGFFGHSKSGTPIFVSPFGLVDVQGLYRSVRKAELTKYEVFMGETMMKQCEIQTQKLGRKIETFCVIMDLQGYGIKHISKRALDFQLDMLQIFEDNYPETMDMTFIINAPAIFPIAYKIFTPFLSDDTKRKVRICGSDYIDEVLKYIDADQIPEYFGGTANDPPGDPKCSTKICYGGEVAFTHFNEVDFTERLNWPTCTVKRGSTVQLDYDVTLPGSILRWQFSTDNHDIGFGVFKRTDDRRQSVGEMEGITLTQRVNSHLVPEEGHIICEQPATYVIRFDNTYSWGKSKKLYYNINLHEPNVERTFDPDNDCDNDLDSPTAVADDIASMADRMSYRSVGSEYDMMSKPNYGSESDIVSKRSYESELDMVSKHSYGSELDMVSKHSYGSELDMVSE